MSRALRPEGAIALYRLSAAAQPLASDDSSEGCFKHNCPFYPPTSSAGTDAIDA
jgi:hypothetical protein